MFRRIVNSARESFINFANKLNTQQELVSRERQLNYFSSLTYLPDPDPVLRAKGIDIITYRELLVDAHLSAVLEKRKAGVLSLLWEIKENSTPKREMKFFNDYFNSIDVYGLIDNILNCIYYGYQPFVIYWDLIEGKRIPRIEDRPQEYFFYDIYNQLRIKSKSDPQGIIADELSFIVSRFKPSYLNPYGDRAAAKIFWPVAFKKGGIKFWLTMTEKYGMPFLVGKVPRGSKDKDIDKLSLMLENMIQDAIAVINNDESVEIKESASKSASADLYERLVAFCNAEISKAILTVTNTVELQGGVGSYAASKTQKAGEEDTNLSDQRIVENILNRIISLTHNLNFSSGNAPKFNLYSEEGIDKIVAERDEILTRVGVKFSKSYIKKTYNLEEDEFEIEVPAKAEQQLNDFAESITKMSDAEIGNLLENIPDKLLQLQIEQVLKPVIDLINKSNDYSEIQKNLAKQFPKMNTSQLESLLEKAIFISEIWGRLNAEEK